MRIPAFLLMLFCLSFQLSAQVIQSITVNPPNPDETDTVQIFIDLSFPSAPCDDKTIMQSSIPPNLSAYAIHCLGILTVICDHTDTITYYQLPPGNYSFTFQVDAGSLPSPCTPGIVPGPSQTINFTVTPVTNVSEINHGNSFRLAPNPASHYTRIVTELNQNHIEGFIYDAIGKPIRYINSDVIDTSDLAAGIYFVQLLDRSEIYYQKLTVIK